ncbi:MAG: enoyl-CoA hydratase-related protein [Pseudomonadota bacterium]
MSDLLTTLSDGVLTLTMNRPEAKNALTGQMLDDLCAQMREAERNPEIGAILITGAGGAFCAGGDVKGFAAEGGANHGMGAEDAAARLRSSMEVSRILHDIPKPTIAAIPGAAAGAGLSIALACDLRIAAAGAKITTAFAKVGLSGDFGGSWFLTRLVGTAKARELYYLSDVILAEEAERIGLVNRVVAPEALAEEVEALAKRLAAGPRIALGFMKRNLTLAETEPLARALDQEALNHSRTAVTEDHREAAKAFVEKRAPVFKGR